METNILIPSLSIIGALSFAALIVFVIAAVQESQHGIETGEIIKRGYLYLVSFVTLLIASAALASLINTGLRATTFKNADLIPQHKAMPPIPYIPSFSAKMDIANPGLVCTSGCTLTAEQKDSIAAWVAQYKDWKRTSNSTFQRDQDIVTAISFLVIAAIVYFFHWLLARRDNTKSPDSAMRLMQLWALAFIFIITSVVTAAFLLNTTLKTVFLRGEDTSTSNLSAPMALSADRSSVESIVTCGSACGLPAETVALAKEWQTTYMAYQSDLQEKSAARTRDNSFAMEIAFLIVALPLFGYHFRTVWGETRTKKHRGK